MTPNEFRAALAQLGLGNYQEAACLLGVQWRAVARYANGGSIPNPVAKLLALNLLIQQEREAAEAAAKAAKPRRRRSRPRKRRSG